MKEIIYDRITGDYAMYLGDELVGYAPNYHEAELRLNALVYAQLSHQRWML